MISPALAEGTAREVKSDARMGQYVLDAFGEPTRRCARAWQISPSPQRPERPSRPSSQLLRARGAEGPHAPGGEFEIKSVAAPNFWDGPSLGAWHHRRAVRQHPRAGIAARRA